MVTNFIIVTMKKQRKTGSKTDTNFFTTEFKLKSIQIGKDRPPRKLNTTCGLFRQHQTTTHNYIRPFSKEQKSTISQLTFLSNNRDDSFRLPQSCSKRAMSKTHDQDHHRLQRKNNPFSEEIHMDIMTKDSIALKKTAATHFIDLKAYRPSTVRTEMKQKLQKSALQKFKEAVHKQNEQNQNIATQEHAEALYEMLKTARTSKELGYRKFKQHKFREGTVNRDDKPKDITANTVAQKQKGKNQFQIKQIKNTHSNAQPYQQVYQHVTSNTFQTDKPTKFDQQSREQFSRSSDEQQSSEQSKSEKFVSRQSNQHQTKQQVKPIQPKIPKIQLKVQEIFKPESITPSNAQKKQIQQVPNKKPAQPIILSRQNSTQSNNNKPQTILTPKYFEEEKKLKDVTVKSSIGPPPKLNQPPPKQPHQNNKHNIQEDELEQVSWGKKPTLDKKPSQNKAQIDMKEKDVETHLTSKQLKPSQALNNAPQPPHVDSKDEEASSYSSEDSPLDELIYYVERIEDIGQYRLNSKDLYNDKSIDKELIQIYKICSYYMAHQFLYLAQNSYKFLSAPSFSATYYNLSIQDLTALRQSQQMNGELQSMALNIQESKKLLKRSYQECKPYLQKDQQILLLDGRTNYHRKCCFTLIKQFRKIYELFQQSPKNIVIIKRCWYLIELYFSLKLLNNEEIKGYEAFEEIDDPVKYINTYKTHLIGK